MVEVFMFYDTLNNNYPKYQKNGLLLLILWNSYNNMDGTEYEFVGCKCATAFAITSLNKTTSFVLNAFIILKKLLQKRILCWKKIMMMIKKITKVKK